MFNFDKLPVWIRFLAYVFILIFVLSIGLCFVFFRELYEYGHSKLFDDSDEISSMLQLNNDETYRIKGFTFYIDRNDISKVKIENLSFEKIGEQLVKLKFTIENTGIKNDFPSLKVMMVDSKGKVKRVIPYSNVDYIHGDKFVNQPVNIDVELKAGEVGYTVKAYYGNEPKL